MADVTFSSEEVLKQAKGNLTALWHVSVLWAREQRNGIDEWASFVGQAFSAGWDEIRTGSALQMARGVALNFATTADMQPVEVTGDDSEAVLTLSGPEQEWFDRMGTNIEDIDRSNEVLLSVIAKHRGLTVTAERTAGTLRMTFSRRA